MIIVAGALYVDAGVREDYLQECRDVITAARASAGCLDFSVSADPIEPDRINVFEHWASVEAVEAFRGSGPSSAQTAAVRRATVVQHEIASSIEL